LKEQISLLIKLQKNDSEIERIKINKEKLPERIISLDEEFRRVRSKVEEERKKFEKLKSLHGEEEEKLKRGIENLKKTKNKLLEVKTNKEYQAMLKEVEIAEGKNSEVEDRIIGVLEEIDNIKEELKIREEELSAYRLTYEKERHEVEEDMNSIDTELLACQKNIGDIREKIDADFLKKYEGIKGIRNGLAVVPVWNEVCGGCHMNIPPQMYNELQRSENLISCPNCNRIIYWTDISKK
jgi:Zn-ribbon protein, possibly nucleic acid-binding